MPRAESLEGRALLATWLVTSVADAGPGTLRDAIEQANLDPAGDRIEFAPTVAGEIGLNSALPDLSTDIVLAGPGPSALTVKRGPGAGASGFRIFTVTAGANVEITGLTISGGWAVSGGGISNAGTLRLADSIVTGNSALGLRTTTSDGQSMAGDGLGGGIDNSGTMTIANARIRGNSATGSDDETDSIYSSSAGRGSGGGIANSGTMTIVDSTVESNQAVGGSSYYGGPGEAGGIANTGMLTIIRSAISGNSAGSRAFGPYGGGASGGGISNSGTLMVTGSLIDRNEGGLGGGLNNAGTSTITNSTISGNSVSFGGRYGGAGQGGGIYNAGSLVTTGSTIGGNMASSRFGTGYGGGIWNGGLTSRLVITATILANEDFRGGNLAGARDQVTSLGHNLFTDAPDVAFDPTDLVNTDPLLGPLADNGGPTRTHALLPGSPAIDAGVAVAGLDADQRGIARPQGSAPDIGAFESRGFAIAIAGGDAQSARVDTPFARPLAVTVTSAFGEPVAGGRVAFAAPAAGPSIAVPLNTASIDEAGRATLDATANGIAGAYAVAVSAAGAGGVSFTLTNDSGSVVPPPPDTIGPVVVGLRRSNFGRRKAFLTLAFSEPLDPARASDPGNYRLVDPGRDGRFGTRDDRRIKIRSAEYDRSAATVTLRPPARLVLRGRFRLTLDGMAPGGIADAAGNPLGDYAATFREPVKQGRR